MGRNNLSLCKHGTAWWEGSLLAHSGQPGVS